MRAQAGRWERQLGEPPVYVEGEEETEAEVEAESEPETAEEKSETVVATEVARADPAEPLESFEDAFLKGYGHVVFSDSDGDKVVYAISNGKIYSFVNTKCEGV